MASTGVSPRLSCSSTPSSRPSPHASSSDPEKTTFHTASAASSTSDQTHRRLLPRHIQLIGIGGTIGTALFVQIGRALMKGGPGSLFIAFTFWCMVICCINNSLSEMVTYLPVSSPFVRFAGRFVDDAFGVAAGWNFFVFEAAMVPFEIVACCTVIKYWAGATAIPDAAIIAICIVLYAALNFAIVSYYGESEFWLSLTKLLLILGLLAFTFFTMVGVNPLKDAYGFRYFSNPGAFASNHTPTPSPKGRFLGFVSCLIQASFTIAGPDYVAITAGEAVNPRHVLPRAFNAVFYRLTAFFVLGSLAVGIVVPYNDPTMAAAFLEGKPGAAASPYVVAMDRLNIPILPHIVNAMVLMAAFSAGNSYVYCASRALYGLALDKRAPRCFTRCTKAGVPYLAVMLVLAIALLSFLQVSNKASVVLSWFVSLVTASQLINYSVISFTYLKFRRIIREQGLESELPLKSRWQPYTTYFALFWTITMCFVSGYEVFLKGAWDVPTFLFSYTMLAVFPILYFGWKIVKKVGPTDPVTVDVFREEKRVIDEYEENFVEVKSSWSIMRAWDKLFVGKY